MMKVCPSPSAQYTNNLSRSMVITLKGPSPEVRHHINYLTDTLLQHYQTSLLYIRGVFDSCRRRVAHMVYYLTEIDIDQGTDYSNYLIGLSISTNAHHYINTLNQSQEMEVEGWK